jgi:hypothetical protein
MRAMWTAVLVLGLVAMAPGCKRGGKPTAAPDDGKGNPTPGSVAGKKGLGTFTVGKATTYVTGPLDASGHIDYAAALNERMSKGITPENNANVLIWKALGPSPLGAKMPPGFFEKLGMSAPPATGDYYIGLKRYTEDQLKGAPGSGTTALDTLGKLGQRPWRADEQLGIQSWLKANDKPMALIVQATTRTQYYSPLIPSTSERGSSGLISSLLPGVQVCREISAALLARAMLYAGHGMADEAWQDLLACHRLGRLVGRGGALIEGLVGIAIETIACRAEIAFLAATQPDAKKIEGYVRDLRSLPTPADPAEKVDLCERFTLLEDIMLIDRQGTSFLTHMGGEGAARGIAPFGDEALSGIDWNPALESANKWFDHILAAMRQNNHTGRAWHLARVSEDLMWLKESATQVRLTATTAPADKGKTIGDILVSLLIPAAGKIQDAADRGTQTFENVIIAFALAQYQRENGKYPDSLDALAPKYLAEVPKDSFTNGWLIYKPAANGYLLYSVGVNGKDDGGRGYDDQPPGDDLVVRMPPVPK